MRIRILGVLGLVVVSSLSIGCAKSVTSNTARTGTEQLLISNAIDQALDKVDFSAFASANIAIEEKYLDSVDKNYLMSSIRHRLAFHGATIVADAKEADIILEPRSGAVGTDSSESFYGMPEVVLPGMLSLPEMKLITRSQQRGTAKIGIVAYEAKTHRILGAGGVSLAVSDQNSWNFMGIGPYKSGSVPQEVTSGMNGGSYHRNSLLPYTVTFDPITVKDDSGNIRLTKGVKGRDDK